MKEYILRDLIWQAANVVNLHKIVLKKDNTWLGFTINLIILVKVNGVLFYGVKILHPVSLGVSNPQKTWASLKRFKV